MVQGKGTVHRRKTQGKGQGHSLPMFISQGLELIFQIYDGDMLRHLLCITFVVRRGKGRCAFVLTILD